MQMRIDGETKGHRARDWTDRQADQKDKMDKQKEKKEINRKEKGTNFKKIGRNDPCHCGSGLKYKKCHG